MRVPFIYIFRRLDGKTKVLFQAIAALKQSRVRAVTRDYAMRLLSVYSDILVS